MTTAPSNFIIGWQEWLALPELGLPAIKAKIDTGARTSALHAFLIEPFGQAEAPMVRFGVHPIPGRVDVAVFCSAPVAGRREVTSSNGEKETRYFIRTPVQMGERTWEIEIGLTNRESMAYRMLLGRQAIRDDMMVDVAASFRQPRLGYKPYRDLPRRSLGYRPLRVALIAEDASAPFNRRLVTAAARRGHILELVALEGLELSFGDDRPGLMLRGTPLPHYDAVVPRIGLGEGKRGAAIVRQLESMGSVALNTGDAVDRLANRLATVQALAGDHVAHVLSLAAGAKESGAKESGVRRAPYLSVLVIGEEAVALTAWSGETWRSASLARHRAERRLAEHAAGALGLGLAAVDIGNHEDGPVVLGVSSRPSLARFEKLTKAGVVAAILDAVEQRVRTVPIRVLAE